MAIFSEANCKNIAVIRKTDEGKLKDTEMSKIRKSHGAAVGALVAGTSAASANRTNHCLSLLVLSVGLFLATAAFGARAGAACK